MDENKINPKDVRVTIAGHPLDLSTYGDDTAFTAPPIAQNSQVGELEQANLRQYHALTRAAARLRAWEDWTVRVLSPEVLGETAMLARIISSEDSDPHIAYRAAVLGAFATLQRTAENAEQSAAALEDLARHYKADVDRLRAAVAEMLLASDQCDGRMQVHQAAAKVGAFIKYDLSSGDAADTVEWRQDDRKDGGA